MKANSHFGRRLLYFKRLECIRNGQTLRTCLRESKKIFSEKNLSLFGKLLTAESQEKTFDAVSKKIMRIKLKFGIALKIRYGLIFVPGHTKLRIE